MKFAFLTSNRFWALVVGGLAIASQGGFTKEAWLNGLVTVIAGFVGIRTIDRATETLSK